MSFHKPRGYHAAFFTSLKRCSLSTEYFRDEKDHDGPKQSASRQKVNERIADGAEHRSDCEYGCDGHNASWLMSCLSLQFIIAQSVPEIGCTSWRWCARDCTFFNFLKASIFIANYKETYLIHGILHKFTECARPGRSDVKRPRSFDLFQYRLMLRRCNGRDGRNLTLFLKVGTSRCDVPARVAAGGTMRVPARNGSVA